MNKLFMFLVGVMTWLMIHPVVAQSFKTQDQKSITSDPNLAKIAPYTVIANPGQDASSEVRFNWHTDLGQDEAYIVFTKKSDKNWKKARVKKAEQELITVFDSVFSKRANGEDFYESVRLIRNTVVLQELQSGTEYMYKFSSDQNAEIRFFKTAPKSGKWSIGIISDMHVYAPLPNRQRAAMDMISQLEKK